MTVLIQSYNVLAPATDNFVEIKAPILDENEVAIIRNASMNVPLQAIDGLVVGQYASVFFQLQYEDSSIPGFDDSRVVGRVEYFPDLGFPVGANVTEAMGGIREIQLKPDMPIKGLFLASRPVLYGPFECYIFIEYDVVRMSETERAQFTVSTGVL